MGTSVEGVRETGVLFETGGVVRLLKWADYQGDDLPSGERVPVWDLLHRLIMRLRQDGERPAAALLGAALDKADATRQLAYRLYTLCEREGLAEESRAYNEIITSWNAIEAAIGA